jgi:hypothetical protein
VHDARKVVEASGGFVVVGTQADLTDREGTLVQDAGSFEVALVSQDGGEVVEAPCGDGVIGAQADLTDR